MLQLNKTNWSAPTSLTRVLICFAWYLFYFLVSRVAVVLVDVRYLVPVNREDGCSHVKSNSRPNWIPKSAKKYFVIGNTETITHRWHQHRMAPKQQKWMLAIAIEAETLPIPPHTQQQSANSTYTSKRVKGRTGGRDHNDLAMVWARAGLSKRFQSGEMTNSEVRCWMEVSRRLCSLHISVPLLTNAHRVRLCQFWLPWIQNDYVIIVVLGSAKPYLWEEGVDCILFNLILLVM
jgi:hypothetical protein